MIDIALRLSVQDGRGRAARCFGLDLALATEASTVALYGPSGAGKSLTLQAMAGLLAVQHGHVRLRGRTLLDTATGIDLPPEARRVGYLFQQYALFPHLTVRQNIGFGLGSWRRRLTPAESARVSELMARFGLSELADSRPAALSGGQQQRVALARALACEPEILLLDEPFAALHTTLRRRLRAELRETQQRLGLPTVLVSHDPEDVMALADEVFLIEGGRVQARYRADDPALPAALEASP